MQRVGSGLDRWVSRMGDIQEGCVCSRGSLVLWGALEALQGRGGSGPHPRKASPSFYQCLLSGTAWACTWLPGLLPGPPLSGSGCLR